MNKNLARPCKASPALSVKLILIKNKSLKLSKPDFLTDLEHLCVDSSMLNSVLLQVKTSLQCLAEPKIPESSTFGEVCILCLL